jgi:hypothetical protein
MIPRPYLFVSLLMVIVTGSILFWTRPQAQAAVSVPSPAMSSPQQGTLPQPKPGLTPSQVVRIQLDALQRNDEPKPESGTETAWNFASPGNKQSTGPLPRFIRMVHNPTYEPMINHRSYRLGQVKLVNQRIAVINAALNSADGTPVFYRFQLSRQQGGPYDGCWMTDAVTPLDGDFI